MYNTCYYCVLGFTLMFLSLVSSENYDETVPKFVFASQSMKIATILLQCHTLTPMISLYMIIRMSGSSWALY